MIRKGTASCNEQSSGQTRYLIIGVGIAVRWIMSYYFADFFKHSPQFVTPNNSFKRFKEGIFLYETGIDPYGGNMFHTMPIFLLLFRPFINLSFFACHAMWTLFDCLTSLLIGDFIFVYAQRKWNDPARAKSLQNFAVIGYLLNPMTIGTSVAHSFASFTNVLIALYLSAFVRGNLVVSVISVALASCLNAYYVILLAAIFLQFRTATWTVVITIVLAFSTLLGVNMALVPSITRLISNTIGFIFTVTDLTPNCGLFWYFFAQVFEHYQLLFLFAFQINAFIYVVPLTATLKKNPCLLSVALLMTMAIKSAYPSYGESAIYLPLVLAFVDFNKYMRYSLIAGTTVVASTILMPIMWRMWIITGTGNANFFFAIVCVYNFAQILLFCDILSAYLRAQMLEENNLESEDTVDHIKFVEPPLF